MCYNASLEKSASRFSFSYAKGKRKSVHFNGLTSNRWRTQLTRSSLQTFADIAKE